MGFLQGSVACTRFNVVSCPENPQFDLLPFRPISPGSSLREKEGFTPMVPGEPYEFGARRWAFRVRIDKVTLDATTLKEKVAEMVQAETDAVGPPGPKARQRMRIEVEEEMMQHPQPRSKIIDCVLEETVLFVGSTSKGHLGTVLELLKRVGVEAEYKTPWLDAGQEEDGTGGGVVDLKEPSQSIWGTRFLEQLTNDPEVFIEGDKGSAKLIAKDGTKFSLSGPLLNQMDNLLTNGSTILSAKMIIEGFAFNFDGLSYRITGLKLDNARGHWTEVLEERLEKIKAVWEWLDAKYVGLMIPEETEDTDRSETSGRSVFQQTAFQQATSQEIEPVGVP